MRYVKLMKIVAVLSILALSHGWVRAQGSSSGSSFVGAWSDVKVSKSGDPHASGLEVELFRHDRELVGFLAEYVGPVADPPVGKLESIRFDEKTGNISFVSKLSVGVVPAPGGTAWVPSKNRYEFNGVIGKGEMTGTLRRKFVQEDGTELAYEENITLKVKTAPEGGSAGSESFEQWMNRWNEVLKKRGPKW